MQHSLDENAMVLKIGHYVSAHDREYMAITKGTVDGEKTVPFLKRRDNGLFLRFFRTHNGPMVPDQEIVFGIGGGVIDQISQRTGLVFEPDREVGGNVCFAHSPELRDDYKVVFSATDVIGYIQDFLRTLDNNEGHREFLDKGLLVVPYPTDNNAFWK